MRFDFPINILEMSNTKILPLYNTNSKYNITYKQKPIKALFIKAIKYLQNEQ